MIRVDGRPPFLTVQDLGRPGWRHLGVPVGGAMDRWALQAANVLAGNAPDAPALECAAGGAVLHVEDTTVLAIAGADADATLDGRPVPPYAALRARAGAVLTIGGLRGGRFLYVAVGGGLRVPPVLGSAATYLPAAFGGVEGRRLRRDDRLAPGPAAPVPDGFACPAELRAELGAAPRASDGDVVIRVVRGPQAGLLDAAGWAALLGEAFAVSATSDRTGYRLEGPALPPPPDAAALPSEPGCPGAVQLPPNGQPIVLMADAPTVGGYPKPAVVVSADLGRLAQCTPGTRVRFAEVSVAAAQRLYRRRRVAVWTLERMRGVG